MLGIGKRQRRRRAYKPIPSTRKTRTISVSKREGLEETLTDFEDSLEASSMGMRSESYWRIILILLFIVVCLMGAIIVCALVPALLEKPGGSSGGIVSDGCQSSAFKIDPTLPKIPSVFQDLNKTEINTVRDFLLRNGTLNLTKYENASFSNNFIFLIELYLPPKVDTLRYLHENGSKPIRRARVVLFNGAKPVPDVEEILVYPLPSPTEYSKLLLADRKTRIPYSARPFSVLEQKGHLPLVNAATRSAYKILRDSFDYWFHNCTIRCLLYLPIGSPGTVVPGRRRSWVTFVRRVPGIFLHPVPFELLIDHTHTDTSRWAIIGVMYANQYFSSVGELVDKYNKNTVTKIRIPPPTTEEIDRGWFSKSGASFINPPLRPPIIFEPNGKRYSLVGRKVRYAGWEFDIGLRTSAGPAVYDIRFNQSRIAYELSVQDAASFYSAFGPKQSSAQYLDSQGKLGAATQGLIKGVDCPQTATYIHTDTLMDTGEAVRNLNSFCIFEMNFGIPSRRHTEMKFKKDGTGTEGLWFKGGLTDLALVVRTVSTPLNYDFIFDFIFHQNGVIESRTSATGYLQTTYYDNNEDPFGYLHYPSITGTIHDHFVLYKVDLDIAGNGNSFQSLDIVARNVSYPWDNGTYRTKKELLRNTRKFENDTLIRFNFDKPKYFVVHNEKVRNLYNNPKGYRIQPQYMVKQLYGDDYFITKAAAWTKYQIAVSKYKDTERFGSCLYNQYGAQVPVCSFDTFFSDNENIQNEDLVNWVVVGGPHIPNTEDIPTTITTGNQYTLYLKPFGFFDFDPSMGSTDAVLMTMDNQKLHVNTFGTPRKSTCSVQNRDIL